MSCGDEIKQKMCPKCKEYKTLSFFSCDKSAPDGLYRWCKKCKNASAGEWQKIISWLAKMENAPFVVATTLEVMAGFRFHVDHDHEINKVRGLLCNKCNFRSRHV